jgi:aminopeptidase
MFTPKQIEKYADVLIWGLKTARKKNYKKNDVVLIRCDLPAIQMAEVLQTKILELGFHPVIRMGVTPGMERNFFEKGNSRQLTFVPPGEHELFSGLNGSIYVHAPASLTHLSGVDPKRIGKAAVARKPLRDLLDRQEEKGLFGWTLCMFPTEELARQAGLSIKEYTSQIVKACYLNRKDPVGEWKVIYKKAGIIKKKLNSLPVDHFHVMSDNMDLRITPGKKRRWIGISGHNIPSFELFLSPDWRGTEGVYYADQPSFRSGNYVEGVRITFKRGKAVKVDAKKGREFVEKQLSMDEGAGRLGEFSLTDKRFSKIDRFMANTLFDENHGGRHGNCHVALGASYSDTFDGDPSKLTREKKNQLGFNDSALHWDLVNTEKKQVTAVLKTGEEKVIYEGGIFKV